MSGPRAWRAPLGLYGLALIAGAVAASRITFPPTEVSAYVLGVARNLVAGHGLVSDAVWSYASGPFVLPRPAFDIWQPLPSFLAALPMTLAGASFVAAQAGSVLLGAAIAPLTWWIARDAARRNGLTAARAAWVALGAGAVAAGFGPFLTAMAGPDSFVPFTVLAIAACAVMPRALDGGRGAGIALGLALGLAYLSRQEAVFFGLAYVLTAGLRGARLTAALRWPVVMGAMVTVPWIVRDALTFQGGLRQTLENAWLTDNAQIFAFLDRPTPATFLAQGPATIVGHVGAALAHDLVDVLLVPGAPVGIVGLMAMVALRRTPALREAGALRPLLVAGAAMFLFTSFAFPVATLWGTYAHASGPAMVALIVATALGLDAALARARRWRGWRRENAWLAPLATLALSVPVAVLSVALLAAGASAEAKRMDALRTALPPLDGAVITDHPMWVGPALGVPALARPHEPDRARQSLGAAFGVHWLLLYDDGDGLTGDAPTAGRCVREVPLSVPWARLFDFRRPDDFGPACDEP